MVCGFTMLRILLFKDLKVNKEFVMFDLDWSRNNHQSNLLNHIGKQNKCLLIYVRQELSVSVSRACS
jgi:hypothetical protein